MRKKNKTILLVSILAIIILGVIGVAYAYSSLFTGNNQQLVLGDIYMHYTESNVLSLANAMPSETYDTNNYFEFTINGKNTYNKDIYYEIVLNHGDDHATRTERLKDNLLKFTLVEINDNTETIVVNGATYDEINATRIWVNTISKNTTSDVNVTYRLYMWVSSETTICGGTITGCDYDMDTWNDEVYASIKVSVIGDFEEKNAGPTAAEKIMAKVGTDGLVAINTDGDLYTGTGTIREYRYSGTNVNNYVYFNCKDSDGTYDYGNENYNYASNCETWRIVGVFEEDGEQVVKIMRNTMLITDELPASYVVNGTIYTIEIGTSGIAYWNKPDTLISTNYNDWTMAGLQYFLNTESDDDGTAGYLSTLTTSVEELIRSTTYKLGNVAYNTTTKEMYTSERNTSNIYSGNQGSWTGSVALLYPSDYGYSVNNAYWEVTTASSGYNTEQSDEIIPKETSWMQMGANHSSAEWLLSPSSSYGSNSALQWFTPGYVGNSIVRDDIIGVRPCLYLVSTATILQGNGSINSPYVVVA